MYIIFELSSCIYIYRSENNGKGIIINLSNMKKKKVVGRLVWSFQEAPHVNVQTVHIVLYVILTIGQKKGVAILTSCHSRAAQELLPANQTN